MHDADRLSVNYIDNWLFCLYFESMSGYAGRSIVGQCEMKLKKKWLSNQEILSISK